MHSLSPPSLENIKQKIDSMEEQKLSYAQQRLWFIHKYENATNAYNIPMIFRLADNTDVEAIKSSIISIVDRHHILKTLINIL